MRAAAWTLYTGRYAEGSAPRPEVSVRLSSRLCMSCTRSLTSFMLRNTRHHTVGGLDNGLLDACVSAEVILAWLPTLCVRRR